MKYHALFVIFEKVANFKLSSAAKYRWRFKGLGSNCCESRQNVVLKINLHINCNLQFN